MNFPANYAEFLAMLLASWPWLLVGLGLIALTMFSKSLRQERYWRTFLVALPIIAIICMTKIIGMFLAFALAMIPITFLVLRHTGVYRRAPGRAKGSA